MLPTPIPAVSRTRSFADSPAMVRNPVEVLTRYTELYGDTFRFYIGGLKEAIVTTNPDVIQHVLKTNADNYRKSEIQVKRMGHFLGKGLLTTHGEAWRTQRRLIQKGFDRKQLEALSSIMQAIGLALSSTWFRCVLLICHASPWRCRSQSSSAAACHHARSPGCSKA